MDERLADRFFSILRQEESHLSRLIEILQADQRAVALSRADEIEANVRLKEAVVSEMQVVLEARRGFLGTVGRSPSGAERAFEELTELLPPARRDEGLRAVERIRSLRAALAELNDLTRRIMLHGLLLVRSTLGLIGAETPGAVYGGRGDARVRSATGRIVRQNA